MSWKDCEFLNYYISIPIENVRNIVADLKQDVTLQNAESCGQVTEYVWKYVWQLLGNTGTTPILEMYNDQESSYSYSKPVLQRKFPSRTMGAGQDVVHFVFQGENGAWDDVVGQHYSHEYVIFETSQLFWTCQAWVDEYTTTWSEMSSLGTMLSELPSYRIDSEMLLKYFYLDQIPEGFGERRREIVDVMEELGISASDVSESSSEYDSSSNSDTSGGSGEESEVDESTESRPSKRQRFRFYHVYGTLRF